MATCRRALPAVAQGAGIRFLGAGSGPAPGTVRVDYAEGTRQHRMVCRFDNAAKLTEVATDGNALTGAPSTCCSATTSTRQTRRGRSRPAVSLPLRRAAAAPT